MEGSETEGSICDRFFQSLAGDVPIYHQQPSDLGLAGVQEVVNTSLSQSHPMLPQSGEPDRGLGSALGHVESGTTGLRQSQGRRLSQEGQLSAVPKTQPQKFTFKCIPVGSSGNELSVRMEHLAANLPPIVAAKLAESVGTVDVSAAPVGTEGVTTLTKKTTSFATKKKLLLVSNSGSNSDQVMENKETVATAAASSYLSNSTSYHQGMPSASSSSSSYKTLYSKQQSAPSPVYKSKLEKAMAQNQLLQNAAKENVQSHADTKGTSSTGREKVEKSISAPEIDLAEKQSRLSHVSKSEIPIQTYPICSYLSSNHPTQNPISRHSTTSVKVDTTHSTQKKEVPIIKPRYEQEALSVTKVAERYKNMVCRQASSHPYHLNISGQSTENSLYQNYEDPEMGGFESQFTYMAPPTHFNQPVEMKKHSALVTEKVYSDKSIGQSIMKYLWQLRADDQFCDAIIFTTTEPVKVHKIVLLAVSVEVQKKVHEINDPEIKLVVPDGISPTNVKTFVYYIYHGEIRLTVENVQPLYRLSCIFGVEELGKYCYDFCKEAKMGHLIIASPYQEAAKPLDKFQNQSAYEDLLQKSSQIQQHGNDFGLQKSTSKVQGDTEPLEEFVKPRSYNALTSQTGHVSAGFETLQSKSSRNFETAKIAVSSQTLFNQQGSHTADTANKTVQVAHTARRAHTPASVTCAKDTALLKTARQTTDEQVLVSRQNRSEHVGQIEASGATLKEFEFADMTDKLAKAGEETKESVVTNTNEKADASDVFWLEKTVMDALDSDWMTNDPSQSNIPIRKRRRNRKNVANTDSGNTKASVKTGTVLTEADQQDHLSVGAGGIENKQNTKNTLKESPVSVNDIGTAVLGNETGEMKSKDGEVKESNYRSSSKTPVKQTSVQKGRRKTVGTHTKKIKTPAKQLETEIVSLPDPLAMGKLDEFELSKLELATDENVGNEKALSDSTVQSFTRFRKRPDNMSVLEVASQKKAKFNDTGPVYTKQAPPRSRRGKRNFANAKSPVTTSSSILLDQNQKTSNGTNVDGGYKLKVTENKNVTKGKGSGQEIARKVEVKGPGTDSSSAMQKSEGQGEFGLRITHSKLAATLEGTDTNLIATKLELDSTKKQGTDHTVAVSPPKKARLRKSGLDQFDIKDKVYMRPPPKKRTKEIREMMQHEEDDRLTVALELDNMIATATSDLALGKNLIRTDKETTVKTLSPKNNKKRPKRSRVKNEALIEKVAELDLIAQKVIGVKLYRCCFCDTEFLFGKRALTHVVQTHEISIDDCVQYINVENKNSPTKDSRVCDICGYKTKECGIYYIHFHKYFRHGVPLPKGWKPFTCDLCKKEFFTKFQLREHKLIHFEDNPFVCNTCGTGFKSRTCLNSHVFHKHNKIKRYKCPECPKSFKTRTQIKVHSRIHSGEKPFLCPVLECTYRSTTRGNMKLHLVSKHKLPNNVVKTYMTDHLEESMPGTEKELDQYMLPPETLTTNTTVKTAMRSRKPDADVANMTNDVSLEILVLSDVNESVSIAGTEGFGTGNAQGLAVNADHVQDFEIASPQDKVQNITDIRDFGQLVQHGNVGATETVESHALDHTNMQQNVQMLLQDVNPYQHNSDTSNQIVTDLQRSAINIPVTMTPSFPKQTVPDQTVLLQHYDSQTTDMRQYPGSSSGNEHGKVLDPQSREARMILKEALEHHTQRQSLPKPLLQSSSFDHHRLTLDNRANQDGAQVIPQSPLPFHEADNLVIDLQDTPSHHDEVVLNLRNQIQQLRGNSHQYRESTDTSLIRGDNVTELLQNIASSQHQTMEQGHFQIYQQCSNSPPVYQSTSHGPSAMTVPVPELDSRSTVQMTPVNPSEGQGQMSQDQAMMQSHGYTPVAPHTSATGQYGPDGTALYQGYYEDQYDIENY